MLFLRKGKQYDDSDDDDGNILFYHIIRVGRKSVIEIQTAIVVVVVVIVVIVIIIIIIIIIIIVIIFIILFIILIISVFSAISEKDITNSITILYYIFTSRL